MSLLSVNRGETAFPSYLGKQTCFFKSMPAALSYSHPTLYVVHGRAKPVLRGLNSTEPKLHTGLDDCLNMLLSCFRKRMFDRLLIRGSFRGLQFRDRQTDGG